MIPLVFTYTHTHTPPYIKKNREIRIDIKVLTVVIFREGGWVISQEQMTFMCGRNVLPKTEIEADCVFSTFEGKLETFSERLKGWWGCGSLTADTPSWMGSFQRWSPAVWNIRLIAPDQFTILYFSAIWLGICD